MIKARSLPWKTSRSLQSPRSNGILYASVYIFLVIKEIFGNLFHFIGCCTLFEYIFSRPYSMEEDDSRFQFTCCYTLFEHIFSRHYSIFFDKAERKMIRELDEWPAAAENLFSFLMSEFRISGSRDQQVMEVLNFFA